MLGLGLSLGLGSRGVAASAPAFDVTTLTATGLYRGSFSGSPWAGTASAGTSGSKSLAEASVPPIAGTAVNGKTPALFDGTKQLGGVSLANYLTTSAYLWWSLFYLSSSGGSGAISGPHVNPALWTDDSAYIGSSFRSSGGSHYIQVWHNDGAWDGNEHQVLLDTWNLICVRYDGTNIRSSLNGGAVSVKSRGNVGSIAGNLYVGRNFDGSARMTGQTMELGFIAAAESDSRFDDILSSVRGTYPAMGL